MKLSKSHLLKTMFKICYLSQQDHGHYSEDEVEDIPEKLPADKEKKTECEELNQMSIKYITVINDLIQHLCVFTYFSYSNKTEFLK